MNHSTRVAPAIIVTAALALISAACSGSPSSAGSGGASHAATTSAKALAYARCVRSHGVPDFPDPDSAGQFSKTTLQHLSASNAQYPAATRDCAHLLPNSSGGPTAAQVRQEWSGMASFARCMRSHGEPAWPDPTAYPPDPSRPTFELPATIQPTPQTIVKMDVCLRLVPHNATVGHIDNDNWQAAQQAMAGQ